jgi:MFS family permease
LIFHQSLGGLPRPFWLLWGGQLITSVGGFVMPFLALYLTGQRGYSASFTGVALAAFATGSGIGTLAGGLISDRLGRRPVLVAGEFLAVAGMVLLSTASSKALVIAGMLVVGTGLNSTRPARAAAVADLVSEIDRQRAYSLLYWATNLGFSVSAVAAGTIAAHGFTPLFIVNILANVLAGILVYRWVPETRTEVAERPVRGAGEPARVGGNRAFIVLLGCVPILGFLFQQPLVTLPLTMTADHSSPADYGLVMMTNGLVIALMQLPLTRIVTGVRAEVALAVGIVVTGIGMGLTAAAHSVPAYAGTVVVWSLGEIVVWPTCTALVAKLAPAHARGVYHGWFLAVWSGSVIVANLLSGQLIQTFGTALVWTACVIPALVAASVVLMLPRLTSPEYSWRS